MLVIGGDGEGTIAFGSLRATLAIASLDEGDEVVGDGSTELLDERSPAAVEPISEKGVSRSRLRGALRCSICASDPHFGLPIAVSRPCSIKFRLMGNVGLRITLAGRASQQTPNWRRNGRADAIKRAVIAPAT